MAFSAVVTPDDLKKGDLVDPGWYMAEIASYEEKPADTDKSTNCLFYFKILDGPFKGVSPRVQFNEKALGFGKKLWEACKIPFDKEKGYALSTSVFKGLVGTKLEIYIKRGVSNKDKEFNEITEYKAIK